VNRAGRRRLVTLLIGAAAQLAGWLLLRPDRAGIEWTDGSAYELWLGVEALLAIAIGLLAPDRTALVVTIGVGWLLQMLHYGFLGEHYDNDLWGLGVFLDVGLAAVAVAVALLARLARRLVGRRPRRLRT
jgi:peptidoglycan/LPS O-acetylase OafA/YrhL